MEYLYFIVCYYQSIHWQIYKIVEPVIFAAVVFLALASSDLAIEKRVASRRKRGNWLIGVR